MSFIAEIEAKDKRQEVVEKVQNLEVWAQRKYSGFDRLQPELFNIVVDIAMLGIDPTKPFMWLRDVTYTKQQNGGHVFHCPTKVIADYIITFYEKELIRVLKTKNIATVHQGTVIRRAFHEKEREEVTKGAKDLLERAKA